MRFSIVALFTIQILNNAVFESANEMPATPETLDSPASAAVHVCLNCTTVHTIAPPASAQPYSSGTCCRDRAMGLRRKSAPSYYEVSDSDDDFVETTPVEEEALKGWGESRQKMKPKPNAKERLLAQDLEQYAGKETPTRAAGDDASVATASPDKPGPDATPERSGGEEEVIHSSPETAPPRRRRAKRARSDDDDDFDVNDADICVEDSDQDFEDDPDESDFELDELPKKKKKKSPPAKKKKPAKSPARATAKAKPAKPPARAAVKPAKPGLKPARPVVRRPLNSGGASGLPGLKPRARMMPIPTSPPKRIVPLSGAPRRRAGLSRLEKVPRLHKYLKD